MNLFAYPLAAIAIVTILTKITAADEALRPRDSPPRGGATGILY